MLATTRPLQVQRKAMPSREDVAFDIAMRKAARSRLTPFCQYVWPGYQSTPYRELMASALEKLESREITRLMIFAPPQISGKSTLCQQFFPAWYLGRNPDHALIMCSYNTKLARRNSSEARNKINEPRYQNVFGKSSPYEIPVQLSPRSKSQEEWGLEFHRGRVKAAGVGAGITGFGAHCLLIDDPVRSQREGDSELSKEEQWEWYWSSAYTRLSPDGVICITMTRWATDDLAGQLLAAQNDGGDKWHVLRLPFMAETQAQSKEWADRNYVPSSHYLVSSATIGRPAREEEDTEEEDFE